jgi:UDP-glucose 4-epimerase
MKILVTGGAGYIGSHTAVELLQRGHDVIIVDNLSRSSIKVLDAIERITGTRPTFIQQDLCDPAETQKIFKNNPGIEAVIHFAAFKAVNESVENPLLYYKNNLYSLVNVLEGMKSFKVPYFVFSSSCTVYGSPEKLPVKEDTPIQPAASPYGETKQICEKIIADTVKSSEIKNISLRYFNPTGAHDTAIIGELPIGIPNNLIPFITQTAIGIRECLSVFGGDYKTPDGTCIRDFIHVVDLAKAHIVALERLTQNRNLSNNEIFNLATGKGYSILETIKSFEKVSGEKLNYKIVGRRPGDVEQIWADTSYANDVLGWKAERDLDNMMLTAWTWEMALNKNKKQELV